MKQYHHIVWVTYSSRLSERSILFKNKIKGAPVWLSKKDEVEIAEYIFQIFKTLDIKVFAMNICGDHVHLLIYLKKQELSKTLRFLKGKTAFLYKKNHQITNSYHLWAQKYYSEEITSKDKLMNTFKYINNNRKKHQLPKNKKLDQLIKKHISTLDLP